MASCVCEWDNVVVVQAPVPSQMSAGHMPCSPPLAANSQMSAGPRPGMPMGPGMGGPAPPMGGPMMGPGGYSAPMPGIPGTYGGQMPAGSNQMTMGSGPASSVGDGMAPVDAQMAVGQQGMVGPNIPSSQQQPVSGPGMSGPVGPSGGFMPGVGPSMAGQMQPNGSSVMTPGVSGPMTTVGGTLSGMSSSVPVGSPAGSQVNISASQATVVMSVSSQIPGGPYMSSGPNMASQVSQSTSTQAPSSVNSIPNQMATYPGMMQSSPQHMPMPGSGVMMPPVPGEMNGGPGMSSGSGNMGNGPGMGPGGGGHVGQMTGVPVQGGGGSVAGPGGMMMSGPVSQMPNNTGVALASSSVSGQPTPGNMSGSRSGNQFVGGPTSSGQMGLPLSAATASQMVGQHPGSSAPRMPNPSNVGQPQMSGTQQPMPYGYGGSVGPGQPPHQSSMMNNMYVWNSASSGAGVPQGNTVLTTT